MLNSQTYLRQQGFTLIEMIIVIVLTAIIGGVVTVFMQAPIQGYFASMTRLQLADSADGALRFVARDIRRALPRSFRTPTTATTNCLEYLPVKAAGRYCASSDACAEGGVSFGSSLTQFGVRGGLERAGDLPVLNDRIVFYNLGLPGNDAYESPAQATTNVALAGSGSTASKVVLSASKTFPASLGALDIGTGPGQLPYHFFVVPDAEQAIFLVCDSAGISNGEGTGRLLRLNRYGVNPSAPTTCPTQLTGATILADKVSRCSLNWRATGLTERLDVLSIELELARSGESVRLYQEVQVHNDP